MSCNSNVYHRFHSHDRADRVETSNVLELGSGTGFIGILVASLQLHAALPFCQKIPSVYLTDVNSNVLARCQNNVGLHCSESCNTDPILNDFQLLASDKSSSHPNIHYKSLDWLDSLSDQESLRSLLNKVKADVVLGADIVCTSHCRITDRLIIFVPIGI